MTWLALIATWFMGISLGTFFLHFFVLAFFLRPQDLKVRPRFLSLKSTARFRATGECAGRPGSSIHVDGPRKRS